MSTPTMELHIAKHGDKWQFTYRGSDGARMEVITGDKGYLYGEINRRLHEELFNVNEPLDTTTQPYVIRYEEGQDDCQYIGLMWMPQRIECKNWIETEAQWNKLHQRHAHGEPIRNAGIYLLTEVAIRYPQPKPPVCP